MAVKNQLSRRVYGPDDKTLGTAMSDVQNLVQTFPVVQLRKFDSIYSEPMTLGNLLEEPFSIELVRVINLDAPTTNLQCSEACHFTFNAQLGGAVINSIDGLSAVINKGTHVRFFFRITYALE